MSSKNPWESPNSPWKNKTAFFTYLRGCLRSSWSKNPIKHNLIKSQRKQITNPNPKGNKPTVWGFTCTMCNENFPIKECQVDHIVPAGSLNEKSDIQGFVERLLWVSDEDLRLCCKKCNMTLAHADRKGISFEEARIEKRVIELCKLPTNKQIEMLTKHNLPCNNAKTRKESFYALIKQEKNNAR